MQRKETSTQEKYILASDNSINVLITYYSLFRCLYKHKICEYI
jgi:hypothetical protein